MTATQLYDYIKTNGLYTLIKGWNSCYRHYISIKLLYKNDTKTAKALEKLVKKANLTPNAKHLLGTYHRHTGI